MNDATVLLKMTYRRIHVPWPIPTHEASYITAPRVDTGIQQGLEGQIQQTSRAIRGHSRVFRAYAERNVVEACDIL